MRKIGPLLLLILAGCASLHESTIAWTHPTKSVNERRIDNAHCMALAREAQVRAEREQALRSQGNDPMLPPGTLQQPSMPVYVDCMIGLGWSMSGHPATPGRSGGSGGQP